LAGKEILLATVLRPDVGPTQPSVRFEPTAI